MERYVVLLRGINVGGKNKIPMLQLKKSLVELGFSDVVTYIASGNVLLSTDKNPNEIKTLIEKALPTYFALGGEVVKVLVLSKKTLHAVVNNKPKGFGEDPEKYLSDAIFLIDLSVEEAMAVFAPREGIDQVWPGDGVIYSQRLSAERVKSRLGKIIGTKAYKSMTIRNWNTTTKLLHLLEE